LDTDLVIERASGDEDLDAVASLEAESFTNPWTKEMLARELSHNQLARVYVVRMPEQRVAAFCSCWVIVDELHINTIAVREDRRRRGLGSLLMRHVLEEARREGVQRATLEVRRSNDAAQRLYEALGFQLAGVRPGYYTHPDEDALILWRDCAAGSAAPEP
jgi:[ribosomal protein S18]-alanine N-acetyltransferase